jgi:hypothetical protein
MFIILYTSRGMVLCIVIYGERDRISSQQEETHFLPSGRFLPVTESNISIYLYKCHLVFYTLLK